MSPSSKSRVLVTGAGGFVGTHVVNKLLEDGYNVTGVVRTGKSQGLRKIFPKVSEERLRIVEIGSIVDADFTDALKDTNALIHVAAVSGKMFSEEYTAEQVIQAAVDGTLNVVQQAIDFGIKKVVVTSSLATMLDSEFKRGFSKEPMTEHTWNPVTEKDMKESPSAFAAYLSSKTIAEHKLWELSDKHPDVDFTAVLPPSIYGDILPGSAVPEAAKGFGTPYFVFSLIHGEDDPKKGFWGPYPWSHLVHVRDVALTHVLALKSAPLSGGRKKRLLISAGQMTWEGAAEVIRKERPEVASRLPEGKPTVEQMTAPMDLSLTYEALGKIDWISWQQTVLDTIDCGLRWEKGAF